MRPLELVSKPICKEDDGDAGSRRGSNYSSPSMGDTNIFLHVPPTNPVKGGFFVAGEVLKEEDEYEHSKHSSSQSRKSSQKTDEIKCDNNEAQQNMSGAPSNSKRNEDTKRENFISRGLRNISRQISTPTSPTYAPSTTATTTSRDNFMRSMLRNNSLSHVQNNYNGNVSSTHESAIRKNTSTPHFGRLARMTSNASYVMSIHSRDSTTNLVYGVEDGTEFFLQPRSAIEQLRRPSFAPIVRPLSRKDIFYSGSVSNIAVPPLPDYPPPVTFDDDKNDNMEMPGTLSRYRYSIISMPKYGGASDLYRGSIVTSHLDIAPAVY